MRCASNLQPDLGSVSSHVFLQLARRDGLVSPHWVAADDVALLLDYRHCADVRLCVSYVCISIQNIKDRRDCIAKDKHNMGQTEVKKTTNFRLYGDIAWLISPDRNRVLVMNKLTSGQDFKKRKRK